jgi:hypothetical protein
MALVFSLSQILSALGIFILRVLRSPFHYHHRICKVLRTRSILLIKELRTVAGAILRHFLHLSMDEFLLVIYVRMFTQLAMESFTY